MRNPRNKSKIADGKFYLLYYIYSLSSSLPRLFASRPSSPTALQEDHHHQAEQNLLLFFGAQGWVYLFNLKAAF